LPPSNCESVPPCVADTWSGFDLSSRGHRLRRPSVPLGLVTLRVAARSCCQMGRQGGQLMGTLTVEAPVQNLLGVPIYAFAMDKTLRWIDETIARRGRMQIGVVNAAKIVNMR